MSEETTFEIDPTPERRPVLPGGKYGADGEATLERLHPGTIKYGKFAGDACINMQVSVLTAEHGFVRMFRDWPLSGQAKNLTLRMLSQLGIDANATRDPATGKARVDTSIVEGQKVIVELSFREYDMKGSDGEATGERASANDIRTVWLRK